MKTEAVQTKATALDQWMYTYTQNRILHHEDCRLRSFYPWKRSKKIGEILSRLDLPVRMIELSYMLWQRKNGIFVLSPFFTVFTDQTEFLDLYVFLRNQFILMKVWTTHKVFFRIDLCPETELLYITISTYTLKSVARRCALIRYLYFCFSSCS